jgi:hypothetical protein
MGSILDALQFDQADLAKICRQPEITLPELSGTNRGYGMGTLYREYAGLPDDEPLAFSGDHGVPLDPDFEDAVDFDHGLPTFLAAYPERAAAFTRRGKPRVVHGAFPIHYAKALLDRNPDWQPPTERRGTIAFPHKSAANIDRSFDFERFAQWLADLPDEFQPVTVCIYWMDVLRDRHLPYANRGMPVVTCGNFFDTQFLFRFIDLCSRAKYACGNGVASSYPLSVVCGCQYFHTDVGPIQRVHKTRGVLDPVDRTGESDNARRLLALAPFPPEPALFEKQRALSAYLTGANRVLSPEQVREIQDWSRNWLLENQTPEIRIVREPKLSDLNTWLPKGIGLDGWAGTGCRVIAAPAAGPTALQAFLKLSPRICREPQTLTVTVEDGGAPLAFECRPGFYALEIPLPENAACEVKFHLPTETDLSGMGNRMVAFRFLGWRRVAEATPRPRCDRMKREMLPDFVTPPEDW